MGNRGWGAITYVDYGSTCGQQRLHSLNCEVILVKISKSQKDRDKKGDNFYSTLYPEKSMKTKTLLINNKSCRDESWDMAIQLLYKLNDFNKRFEMTSILIFDKDCFDC